MEASADLPWYLRKNEDGNVFGPLPFEQLARWAATAQVAPHDSVSTDQETWIKAPMLDSLGMDWIVEVTSERFYGPTALGAVQEFIRLGEIDNDTFVINACDGTRCRIREMSDLRESRAAHEIDRLRVADEAFSLGPASSRISISSSERIRELEEALREHRQALARSEARCQELEAQARASAPLPPGL